MPSEWISLCKRIQVENHCSYKKAMQIAKTHYHKNGGNFITENRIGYKPKVREMLSKIGDVTIKQMFVVRRAISKYLSFIIHLFKPKNHDQLFHLFIVCFLEDNHMIVVEKNEDINVSTYSQSYFDQLVNVPITSPITINDMLKNAVTKYGNTEIFDYEATSRNCQRFCYDVLEASSLMTDTLKNFILQDVSQLMPTWAKKIAYIITSFKNRANQAVDGKGEIPYMLPKGEYNLPRN